MHCRRLGFDNLNPIIWHKIANASYEVSNGSKFLGKPYEPNAIIKNDIEFILMQRKPGGYRKPTEEQRRLSMIPKDKFDKWFQQFWNLTGASTKSTPPPSPRTGLAAGPDVFVCRRHRPRPVLRHGHDDGCRAQTRAEQHRRGTRHRLLQAWRLRG